jgi:hypothetical protein
MMRSRWVRPLHGVEAVVEGLQVAALHEVVALAVREVGQRGLNALGVDENVGLVGAAIDGGASQFGEPEWLGLRHPGRGRGGFDAAGAVEVLVEAQPGDVLIFRWRRTAPAKHCAILSTPTAVIHALEGAPVSEVSLSPWWRRHLAGTFAFPGASEWRTGLPGPTGH